ncbi:hypothetical protein F2Q69_00058243 [Brassica cretica]|uniref:Uncharacterized protein n=1 Tax=Brassica cretica TaxID=69181 RepID=A0A8S9REG5_BRACR|nr:hypothetical protein F2Q69_00058243 [Brassica cretica]
MNRTAWLCHHHVVKEEKRSEIRGLSRKKESNNVLTQVPDIGDGFRARIAGPNFVVVLVVVCRSLLPQMPLASPIEDRGTTILIEDRDRGIPERLRLCGVIVKGLPASLMWRKNDYVGP